MALSGAELPAMSAIEFKFEELNKSKKPSAEMHERDSVSLSRSALACKGCVILKSNDCIKNCDLPCFCDHSKRS